MAGWPEASFATVDQIADRTRQICSRGIKLHRFQFGGNENPDRPIDPRETVARR